MWKQILSAAKLILSSLDICFDVSQIAEFFLVTFLPFLLAASAGVKAFQNACSLEMVMKKSLDCSCVAPRIWK